VAKEKTARETLLFLPVDGKHRSGTLSLIRWCSTHTPTCLSTS